MSKEQPSPDKIFMAKIAHLGPRTKHKLVSRRLVKARLKSAGVKGIQKRFLRKTLFNTK